MHKASEIPRKQPHFALLQENNRIEKAEKL